MSKAEIHRNNPLQGLGLKPMLEELVTYYGFDILYAYLNFNCFKTNASIAASVKFLKKTEWAREKVELFYLYQYKNLPAVSSEQFNVAPRERIVPEDQKPRQPAKLSIEDAERLQLKRAKNAASRNGGRDGQSGERKGSSGRYNDKRRSNSGRDRSSEERSGSSSGHSNAGTRRTLKSGSYLKGEAQKENGSVTPFNPWGNYKKEE